MTCHHEPGDHEPGDHEPGDHEPGDHARAADGRADGLRILSGYPLRCFLVLALRDTNAPLCVADLVRLLAESGCTTGGRPSKGVSDALRCEVDRGRVHRLRRATYVFGQAPRTTLWRMRRRLDDVFREPVGVDAEPPGPVGPALPGRTQRPC